MAKKLYVGGLAWSTTEQGLREAFESFGSLAEVSLITDRYTGESRGFGFVSFENPAEGDTAIKEMDGATLDGRTIKVNEAHDRNDRGGDRRGGGGGGGGGRGGRGGGGGGGQRW